MRQALWIAVCGGATIAVLLQHVEPAYRLLGVDERAIPVAAGYLRAASLGLPAMLAYVALRCLCEGMSWTRPAMLVGHGDVDAGLGLADVQAIAAPERVRRQICPLVAGRAS